MMSSSTAMCKEDDTMGPIPLSLPPVEVAPLKSMKLQWLKTSISERRVRVSMAHVGAERDPDSIYLSFFIDPF